MRIIDVNAYIGYDREEIVPRWTDQRLLQKLAQNEIDGCVAYDTRAVQQLQEGNADMRQAAERSGGKIQACYVIHPYLDGIQMPEPAQLLEQLQAERPAAARLFPKEGRYRLNAFYCAELLSVLRQLRLPVMLGCRDADLVSYLPDLALQYPEIPFVVTEADHTRSMFVRAMLRNTGNVYFSMGRMCGAGELDQLVREYSAERFVFGSSCANQTEGALALIYYGSFSEADRATICAGTWQHLQEGIQWT